jgi:protein-disulfide isomerase
MRRFLLYLFLVSTPLAAIEKLSPKYRVAFGDPTALLRVTEYFSFMCPHCISLFRDDFKKIKASYIDKNKIYWEFHVVPLDIPSVQAMVCFETLTENQKRLFLEVILDEADDEDPAITSHLMKKAMELLKAPIPHLLEEEFLTKTEAFKEAFRFISQEDGIEAIPSVEINGKFFPEEVPEFAFIQKKYTSAMKGGL